jgi:hypothetical protein
MSATAADAYRAVISEAATVDLSDATGRRRTLGRLRRELHRINRRDFFPPPERDQARSAVVALAALTEVELLKA